jgi:hypothetical protein
MPRMYTTNHSDKDKHHYMYTDGLSGEQKLLELKGKFTNYTSKQTVQHAICVDEINRNYFKMHYFT